MPRAVIDNNRYLQLCFTAKMTGTVHGFVGYFDATLYKDVHCSILPATFSDGMFSWFPIFFPLRVRVHAAHAPSSSARWLWPSSSTNTAVASVTTDAGACRARSTRRSELLAQLCIGQGVVRMVPHCAEYLADPQPERSIVLDRTLSARYTRATRLARWLHTPHISCSAPPPPPLLLGILSFSPSPLTPAAYNTLCHLPTTMHARTHARTRCGSLVGLFTLWPFGSCLALSTCCRERE